MKWKVLRVHTVYLVTVLGLGRAADIHHALDRHQVVGDDSPENSAASDSSSETCTIENGEVGTPCDNAAHLSSKGRIHFQIQVQPLSMQVDMLTHNHSLPFAKSWPMSLLGMFGGLQYPFWNSSKVLWSDYSLGQISTGQRRGDEKEEPRYPWQDNLPVAGGLVVFILLLAIACMFCRRNPASEEVNGTAVPSLHPERAGAETEADNGSDDVCDHVKDTMTYRTEKLITWAVFTGFPCTVWDNETLWFMMRRLLGVALVVAVAVFLCVPDPKGMDPSRFSSVGTVLNVFVGLLLSFFLASTITRWYACVTGFLVLFNSVRNMQMQLHALGVKRERSDLCVRYGVLSAWLLTYELRRGVLSPEMQEKARDEMWEELMRSEEPFTKMEPKEQELLKDVDDPSGLMWTWVGSLVGRMAQSGEIPTMSSPTYGRIIDLAQTGQDGLRQVRSAIVVQMPFVYMHTLACIVQLNNLLAAISFGLTLGVMVGDTFTRISENVKIEAQPEGAAVQIRPLIEDVQAVVVQLFKCFVVPILYQAFLEIGISIASPFSSEDGAIPAEKMLNKLHKDLSDANTLAENPPLWQAPEFQCER